MNGKRSNIYFTSEMKKGVKEKWNLPNRSGREILILKRVQMMCFKKKKKKRKRKKVNRKGGGGEQRRSFVRSEQVGWKKGEN